MRRLFDETWLPTAVFAGLPAAAFVGLGLSHEADPWETIVGGVGTTVTALLLVPLLWRWHVMVQGRPHAGRAAFSGAALAYVIAILPLMVLWAVGDARTLLSGRSPSPGLGAFLLMLPMFYILGALPVAGALGAVVGSIIALIQRWSASPIHEPRPPATLLDGAFFGGQVGALGGMVIAFLLTASLSEPITRALHWPILPIGVALLSTWLLTIALSARIGVIYVKRMRQIDAREAAARPT